MSSLQNITIIESGNLIRGFLSVSYKCKSNHALICVPDPLEGKRLEFVALRPWPGSI